MAHRSIRIIRARSRALNIRRAQPSTDEAARLVQAAKLPKPPRPARAVPPQPVKPPKLAKVERAVPRQVQSLPRLSFKNAGR